MTNTVKLDNIEHRDLRVITRFGPEFGDNINQTLVFPTEFAEIQREYPIFLRKEAEGGYQAVALLGLDKGENLFLEEGAWRARYVPAMRQRGPFAIGLEQRREQGEIIREPMIHIDLDHPRVSRSDGEPLFLPQGGNAPYLERVARILKLISQGLAVSQPMYAAFAEYGLIEPVALNVQLNDREKYTLPDLHTISQDRLARLDGASLERLSRAGFLPAAYCVAFSLDNVNRLIALKSQRRAAL